MSWEEVLTEARARLSPEDAKAFARLHKNFTGYASEATLTRFYGFVFSRGLEDLLCGFRSRRLERILAGLAALRPGRGARILEVGAGAGVVSEAAREWFSPEVSATHDICAEARVLLAAKGFTALPHPLHEAPPEGGRFDLILCPDSLGEINADEDGFLRDPENAGKPGYAQAIEDRYGFAQKLEPWKAWLARSGRLVLWEPIAHRAVWNALAGYLGAEGWRARLSVEIPGGEYLELSLP